jgi:hypothetical protein
MMSVAARKTSVQFLAKYLGSRLWLVVVTVEGME